MKSAAADSSAAALFLFLQSRREPPGLGFASIRRPIAAPDLPRQLPHLFTDCQMDEFVANARRARAQTPHQIAASRILLGTAVECDAVSAFVI
jgi:hypothetical protein